MTTTKNRIFLQVWPVGDESSDDESPREALSSDSSEESLDLQDLFQQDLGYQGRVAGVCEPCPYENWGVKAGPESVGYRGQPDAE